MGLITRFMLSKIIGFCFVDIASRPPTGFMAMLLYRAIGPPRGYPVCGFGLGVKENLGASQALVPQHTLIQFFFGRFFWRRLTRLNNALNLDSC